MTDRITKAQIAKIWASAHELGFDRETLYLLVPRGSITNLTRREAADLIERLSGGARRTHPPNHTARPSEPEGTLATGRQRSLIAGLFDQLGWTAQPHRIRGFLHKFAHVETLGQVRSRKRAIALIEALKSMVKRKTRSQAERN